jgi:Fe-S cluster assembly protein SufD
MAPARPPTAAPCAWATEFLASLQGLESTFAEAPADARVPASLRESGRDALAALPLPSRRQEAWRFTTTAPLTAIAPRLLEFPGAAGPAEGAPPPSPSLLRLCLDGRSDPLAGIALPDGLAPLTGPELEQALGRSLALSGCADHWPVLLNQAAAGRLLALRVSAAVATTLELVSDAGASEGVLPLRILLVLEEQASLELLQVHRATGASLTSVVLEASLAPGAQLRHGLLARGSDASVLLAHVAVQQAARSHYSLASVSAGWGLARLEPRIVQSEGRANSRLRGLQVVHGHQVADTHSQVLFNGPEGELDQLHKAVADDAGHSVFNGAVRVPREAQRTAAAQLSRSLLLSPRARIDTKPELEIVADDVKCAHGATVSRLQLDELFYLQSRGIAAEQASRLLLRGFCEEVLRELPAAAALWQPLQGVLGQEVAAGR